MVSVPYRGLLLWVSLRVAARDDDLNEGRIRREERRYTGCRAFHEVVSLISSRAHESYKKKFSTRRGWTIPPSN
jgi:hypothetical protein